MNLRRLIYLLTLFIFFGCGFMACKESSTTNLPPPNILWITSEDNSPWLGCYGDTRATTPNLDRLASSGFLYTHAYANSPICAPTRSTIITGVYANSSGNQNMRSYYKKSDRVKFFPEFLREAGYYCTNNSKEDYNIVPSQTQGIWNESSKDAHYKNRKEGQPFFAVFNCIITHESSLHQSIPSDRLRHRPEDVVLPPYHPDTEEMRHDWAQYYDKVEDMDKWVGQILLELQESGEAENTLVFYYSDHGGVLARSKRYVYETGTHVPFILHIPEKYKHLYPASEPGSKVNRLISFVDLAPTLLSILGITVPEYMQGQVFLGESKSPDPEYAFMFRDRMDERYDLSRAVRDKKYRYIRNYMPHRIYGQYLEYLWRAPSIGSWEEAYRAGKCDSIQGVFWNSKPIEELYDTENDPWEIRNLAKDPAYEETLIRLRKANQNWMSEIKDTGFIPEAELSNRTVGIPAYDYMRTGKVDHSLILHAAETSISGTVTPEELRSFLQSDDAAIRYWGATGLLNKGEAAKQFLPEIKIASRDSAANVASVAAELLYRLGEKQAGRAALLVVLKSGNAMARNHALNVIDEVNDSSKEIKEAVISMVQAQREMSRNYYDLRSARQLFIKWKVDMKQYGINMDW